MRGETKALPCTNLSKFRYRRRGPSIDCYADLLLRDAFGAGVAFSAALRSDGPYPPIGFSLMVARSSNGVKAMQGSSFAVPSDKYADRNRMHSTGPNQGVCISASVTSYPTLNLIPFIKSVIKRTNPGPAPYSFPLGCFEVFIACSSGLAGWPLAY